jgi:hypothetical protein
MDKTEADTVAAVGSIWTRLILNVKLSKDGEKEPLTLSAVERQTENSRKGGTIWEAVRKADFDAMKRLVQEDPKNIDARGPVGECPIHMLFLYGSDTHLDMARYLLTQFPHTITQIYNQPVRQISLHQLIDRGSLSRNIMVK